MAYVKTTHADRNVQYPNRYTDELSNVKTFTRSPGTVTQAGTTETATVMNNIENGIDALHKNTHEYAANSSGTDAYAVTFSPAYTSYYAGMIITFSPVVGNSGAATLNVNGLGAKTIYKVSCSGSMVNLQTGDIVAAAIYTVVNDGPGGNFILLNPSSLSLGTFAATGDLIYGTAAGQATILAKGTAFQALEMNSGATAPLWATSVKNTLSAAGDMLYASAANVFAKLAKGTAYQGLRMNSGETAPEWGNIMIGGRQVYTAGATFTAPKTGLYKVTCTGGGGSGARNASVGGGGGGGGTAIEYVTLTKNDAVTVTIGAGGTAPSTDTVGENGGTSSFGAYCSATGGIGGQNVAGGGGGLGSSGDLNLYGCYGINGNTGYAGGGSFWGGGNNNYDTGTYGGGGAGFTGTSGAHNYGEAGVILIEW